MMDQRQLRSLSGAILDAYNQVAECPRRGNCRHVENVRIRPGAIDSIGSTLESAVPDQIEPQRFNWLVEMEGFCEGCTSFPTLYESNGVARSQSRASSVGGILSNVVTDPSLRQSVAQSENVNEPPSRGQFLMELNKLILNLKKSYSNIQRGYRSFAIEQAVGVSELRRQHCLGSREEFSGFVVLNAKGFPRRIQRPEIKVIAEAFANTYNAVNPLSRRICDPSFRVITSAQAILAPAGHRVLRSAELSDDRRDLRHATRGRRAELFTVRIYYKGMCSGSGCSRTVRLFDPEGRPRELSSSFEHEERNLSLRNEERLCLCPYNAHLRGPYESEFDRTFEETFQSLRDQKLLPSVGALELWRHK